MKIEDGYIKDDIKLRERYECTSEKEPKKAKSLSLAASFKLALKNMRLKATSNILVALGESMGVLSVILMLSLGSGVTKYINEEINSSLNPLMIDITNPDKAEPSERAHPGAIVQYELKPMTQKDINKIKKIAHVSSVEKVATLNGKTSAVFDGKRTVIQEVSMLTKSIDSEILTSGNLPKENEILLTSEQAKALTSAKTYKTLIGKKILVYVNEINEENKPVILEKELTVSGLADQQDNTP